MKNFVLIGASGYIAPRHLKAIKDTGNNLIAALDPFDSVGIIDSYFPNADFFTESERFERHIEKIKQSVRIDYVSICSPNFLHDAHIRMALRWGANAICEKPLVLNTRNAYELIKKENEHEKNIYNVLQLREHKSIKNLKRKIESSKENKIYDIELTYITPRGNWYYTSWKGSEEKSGGVATNIGVHFFDMLIWIFGKVIDIKTHIKTHDRASGFLKLDKANVKWFLSVNYDLVPEKIKNKGQRTFRSIKIEGDELEFSEGFTDLHTKVYEKILDGKGFGVLDALPAIDVVTKIRKNKTTGLVKDSHTLAKEKLSSHPFKID